MWTSLGGRGGIEPPAPVIRTHYGSMGLCIPSCFMYIPSCFVAKCGGRVTFSWEEQQLGSEDATRGRTAEVFSDATTVNLSGWAPIRTVLLVRMYWNPATNVVGTDRRRASGEGAGECTRCR